MTQPPGAPESGRAEPTGTQEPDSVIEEVEDPTRSPGSTRTSGQPTAHGESSAGTSATTADAGHRGWSGPGGPPTTVILVRHGVTPHTKHKRFSGGLASSNPGLSDEGREQVSAAAAWLKPIAADIDAVIASPVRRTLESAEIIAAELGHEIEVEPGFAEMEFGTWDGLTFSEVAEKYQDDLDAWLGSLDVAAGGGESFREVQVRVLAGLDRLLDSHAGQTVVVVSHVTPIKTLVSHVVGAPLEAVYRMELTPASVTVLSFFAGGPAGDEPMGSMRLYNARPGADVLPPSRS
ncbi:histidine phosphatase family protein [Nocardioides sp. JQ2195]|uniref:histidine phosphatase family protein n=1 Tax=Nocardioides sp. JQ2195 TaxID=2592334 RepID=UPI001F0D077D|nr:histidine phosphatase family protein [Nocardioides sp. JQ2195]